MMWYSAVINYPLNIGGRPLYSWPAFIPITFELTVLFAVVRGGARHARASTACRCPITRSSTCPSFALASRNRFFLCIEADDPQFDLEETRRFLESLEPKEVCEVDH